MNNKHITLPSLWEVSIILLLFYSLIFQYAYKAIDGAMIVLSFFCVIIGIWNFFSKAFTRIQSFYNWIILFVLYSVLTSLLFGVSSRTSMDVGMRMLEYCFTGFSIFLFSITHKHRLVRLFTFIWIFLLILGIVVLIKGSNSYYSGALGIEELNTNELSSLLLLFVFCSFYLFGSITKHLYRIILIIALLFIFFVQIQTASRRGFIVMLFIIVMSTLFAIIPYLYPNASKNKLIAYSFLIIIAAIAFVELRDYIFNNTVLGERLTGNMTGGDFARERYHRFAFEQFKQHPIWGIGIGGVEYLQGVYSHSLYFETLACTGLLGSVLLGYGLTFPIITLGKRIINSFVLKNGNVVNDYCDKILFVFLLGLLISGFAVVMIYDFNFYIALALLAAGINNHSVSSY